MAKESRTLDIQFWIQLTLGSILLFLSQMRFGIGELGWVAFAPFLVALYREGSWKRHLVVLLCLLVVLHLVVAKIITAGVPWYPIPMFGIPISLMYFVTISVSAAAYRRLGWRWGVYLFPALAVTFEWLQYSFTEGGSWGALAYTQVDNLRLIQFASIAGIAGISFLVAFGSSLAAAAYTVGFRKVRWDLSAFLAITVAILFWGECRLSKDVPGTPVRVAGISTPVSKKDFGEALNDISSLRKYDDILFTRTVKAAELGAKIVAWDEVSTMVTPAEEEAFTARGQTLTKERGMNIVMAYGVLLSTKPLQWQNKYRFILADGTIADEYLKRHPVPGDGDVKGTAHAKTISLLGGGVGGALCYDYDFPQIALDNVKEGAGMIVIPSSDWRGIDPIHAQMARMNAVAVGVSMLRPVREATSMASDQYGRIKASMRYGGNNENVMVTELKAQQVPTLYAKTGNVLPMLTSAFCAFAIILMAIKKKTDAE